MGQGVPEAEGEIEAPRFETIRELEHVGHEEGGVSGGRLQRSVASRGAGEGYPRGLQVDAYGRPAKGREREDVATGPTASRTRGPLGLSLPKIREFKKAGALGSTGKRE